MNIPASARTVLPLSSVRIRQASMFTAGRPAEFDATLPSDEPLLDKSAPDRLRFQESAEVSTPPARRRTIIADPRPPRPQFSPAFGRSRSRVAETNVHAFTGPRGGHVLPILTVS